MHLGEGFFILKILSSLVSGDTVSGWKSRGDSRDNRSGTPP